MAMNSSQIKSLAESGEMHSAITMITPEKAKQIIELQPRNRKVIDRKVNQYAQLIVCGKWSQDHPQGLIFNKQGELIDGQHRLLAVVKANVAVKFYCTFNAETSSQLLLDTATPRRLDQTAQIMGMAATPTKIAIAKVLLLNIQDAKLNRFPCPDLVLSAFQKYEQGITFASEKRNRLGINTAFVRAAIARAYYHCEDTAKLDHFIEVLDSGFSTESSDASIISLRNACIAKSISTDAKKLSIYKKALFCLANYLQGKTSKQLMEAKTQPFLLEIDNG
jgi:hypothetical protein